MSDETDDSSVIFPPILEVYVVWHPGDRDGEQVFVQLFDHFHSPTFAGLVGGAVEVYPRSAPWGGPDRAPRPTPVAGATEGSPVPAAVTVYVPVLGTRLARATNESPAWRSYLQSVAVSPSSTGALVGIFPLEIDAVAGDGTLLVQLFSKQRLDSVGATDGAVLARDLAHSIAGLIGDPFGDRLRVFISHTKRYSPEEEPDVVDRIVQIAREVIGDTHMSAFFDRADLQPGVDPADELIKAASTSGLLAIRSDLYSSREWCQREMLAAKRADMPIVVLQALHSGDGRGSYLLDHVPTIPLTGDSEDDIRSTIERCLNQLTDEALKRALWNRQRARLAAEGFAWLPANAPEPVTILDLLLRQPSGDTEPILVMHPDPPLGTAELSVLQEMLRVAGLERAIEIVTPRTFASRGGEIKRG